MLLGYGVGDVKQEFRHRDGTKTMGHQNLPVPFDLRSLKLSKSAAFYYNM